MVYDIDKLEFGDTYFIGNNSSSLEVHQIEVFNGQIYAATDTGVFIADITSNLLIDFNNWNEQFSGRNFSQITLFNNQLYVVEGTKLYRLDGSDLVEVRNFNQTILAIKASTSNLSVTLETSVQVLDSSMNISNSLLQIQSSILL